MRTLDASLLAELALTVTRPGYLVQIDFAVPLRLSTMGDVSYAGYTWAAADVRVSGLGQDERGQARGRLSIGNALTDYGAQVLLEGVSDRRVQVWACYAAAAAYSVKQFDGVADAAEIGDRVDIELAARKSTVLYAPRRFINASSGFTVLIPAGAKLTVGAETFVLERQ